MANLNPESHELHFCRSDLASGFKWHHVPLNVIRHDINTFILSECLPPNIEINDPRNMSRESIQWILQHWYTRQENARAESAFRFLCYIGRGQRTFSALYPTEESKNAKGSKGKERQVEILAGLLPMEDLPDKNPSWHDATASCNEGRNGDDIMVRIDMGQMKMLKVRGINVLGPVNGPNEGFPQYEVRKSALQFLLPDDDNPGSSSLPRPIYSNPTAAEPSQSDSARPQTTAFTHDLVEDGAVPESAPPPLTPKKRLGKRTQIQQTPLAQHVTRNATKRKKIGDDECAAMEAKEFITTATRPRRKPKRG